MNHNGKSRDELAREANQVRSKLLRTVEQLDRRRHDALDLPLQLKRHVRQLMALGALLLVATAGAMAIVVHRVATLAERRRRDRWILAKNMWRHPERAMRGERGSFFGELARSVLLTMASAAVSVPARRAIGVLASRRGSRQAGSG
jgi:hypothetical protein